MNRTAIGMPIWVGLLSLTLAATGQVQIVAVRPALYVPQTLRTRRSAPPIIRHRTGFQDPASSAQLVWLRRVRATVARSRPHCRSAPGVGEPSIANVPAGGPLCRRDSPPPAAFDVGNDAWGEPSTVGAPNWEAVMARRPRGRHRRSSTPPGQYQPYTPSGGGFLGGGVLRMLFFGNRIGRPIQSSGSQEFFAGWKTGRRLSPTTSRLRTRICSKLRDLAEHSRRQHPAERQQRRHQGFNLAAPVPWLEDSGFGGQFGMSYGAFG